MRTLPSRTLACLIIQYTLKWNTITWITVQDCQQAGTAKWDCIVFETIGIPSNYYMIKYDSTPAFNLKQGKAVQNRLRYRFSDA